MTELHDIRCTRNETPATVVQHLARQSFQAHYINTPSGPALEGTRVFRAVTGARYTYPFMKVLCGRSLCISALVVALLWGDTFW